MDNNGGVNFNNTKIVNKKPGFGGGVYGLGFIGAVVYYIQTAPSFWLGVFGILKALVWPAMIVYKLLQFLYM